MKDKEYLPNFDTILLVFSLSLAISLVIDFFMCFLGSPKWANFGISVISFIELFNIFLSVHKNG
jgi:hypothetical protein